MRKLTNEVRTREVQALKEDWRDVFFKADETGENVNIRITFANDYIVHIKSDEPGVYTLEMGSTDYEEDPRIIDRNLNAEEVVDEVERIEDLEPRERFAPYYR